LLGIAYNITKNLDRVTLEYTGEVISKQILKERSLKKRFTKSVKKLYEKSQNPFLMDLIKKIN